jgi:hypothetical protein
MKKRLDVITENNNLEFIEDYKEITETFLLPNTVIVTIEWQQKGDFFQKLSTYDYSYSPVKTLGSTTLIKAI